jgi:thioredoxin-related protein
VKLERVANVVVIVTCLCIIVRLAVGTYPRKAAPPVAYRAGEKIADTKDLGLRTAKKTLIIFENSKCPFCRQSMPFYARAIEVAHKYEVRVVALTSEDTRVNALFLQSQGVLPNAVVALKDNSLKVHGTPTLILARQDGKVAMSWLGKLTPEHEAQVMKEMGQGLAAD